MGQPQIIEKLEMHLGSHTPPTEECHVLYLMAEIRKFLEQGAKDARFSALEFYGNWCVHSLISRNSEFINQISPHIHNGIQQFNSGQRLFVKGDDLAKFLSLEHLKQALLVFLADNYLPTEITVGANWEAFRSRLFGILSEQPFEEPKHSRFIIVYDKHVGGNVVVAFATGKVSLSQADIA